MATRLEIADGGRIFWCFDRRGTRISPGILNINGACGAQDIEVGTEVSEWISADLAKRNGSLNPCFIWLDPHAARLLWFEGVLPEDQIAAVAENGQRSFKDGLDVGECFVWPDVPFEVGNHPVNLTVVISSRDLYQQISIVEGEVPDQGIIDLGSMTKQTNVDAV